MPGGLADRIAGYVTQAYKSVPRRGAESGGLLLGGVRLGPVIDIFITGFEPIPCDYLSGPSFTVSDAVQAEFRMAKARYSAAEIVGFYRSHTRKGPGLDLSDQEIVDRIFPGLSGLVLLIKPTSFTTFDAGYFFFQSGRLQMQPAGPDFPFLVSVPGGTPPPTVPEPDVDDAVESGFPRDPVYSRESGYPNESDYPREPAFKALMQDSLRFTSETPDPRSIHEPEMVAMPHTYRRRNSLQWEIVAAGLMIAAALALLWWQYRGASGEDVAITQSVPARIASLGLSVKPGAGGWRISWDPNSSAAIGCVRGTLNISEDESKESIPLTFSQVRNGSATYRPTGDDITFRLDLVGRDTSLSSETYRVLLKPREAASSARPSREPAKPTTPAEKAPKAESPVPREKAAEESPAPAYVESEVVSRVTPDVPEGIRPRITSPLSIDVRVSIDSQGRVTKAAAVQHQDGLVDYLAKRAVAAAQGWTFRPAKRAGKAVESTRTIHFVFEQ